MNKLEELIDKTGITLDAIKEALYEDGYVIIPRKPTLGRLASMGLRYDHSLFLKKPVYAVGDRSHGICQVCERIVATTFEYRNLRDCGWDAADVEGVANGNVLTSICDECGEIISYAPIVDLTSGHTDQTAKSIVRTMSQLYEEISGEGFYTEQKEQSYVDGMAQYGVKSIFDL